MSRYILRRLVNPIPVLLGITLLVFIFLHLIPGDPAVVLLGDRATPDQVAALRERLGLNEPLPLQYMAFLRQLVRLDFGTSIFTGVPIIEEIKIRWPATFELSRSFPWQFWLASPAAPCRKSSRKTMCGRPLEILGIARHALKNALLTVTTITGLEFGTY